MKRILLIFTLLSAILNIHTIENPDDYYLNLEINIPEEKNTDTGKKWNDSSMIKGSSSITQKSGFKYNFLKESPLNPGNIFDIEEYRFYSNSKVFADIKISSFFSFVNDSFFEFTINNDEIKELRGGVNELYFSFIVPVKFLFQFSFGRIHYRHEKSFVFNSFNGLALDRKVTGGTFTDDEAGANMFKISMFFPMVNFDIIYSPGSVYENETAYFFGADKSQKFYTMLNFNFPHISFGFNCYIDTDLFTGGGFTISANIHKDMVIYSDFSVNNYEKRKRLVKENHVLYGDMYYYNWDESERLNFRSSILGINLSPGGLFQIYTELFFNSNGLTPDEQKNYIRELSSIKKHYEKPLSPMSGMPVDNYSKDFSAYYKGKLGESLRNYDPAGMSMLLLYTSIGKSDIASKGINLKLSTLTSCFDGSTVLVPEFSFDFFKYISFSLKGEIYLGYSGALFDESPYAGSVKAEISLKL